VSHKQRVSFLSTCMWQPVHRPTAKRKRTDIYKEWTLNTGY